ncbi:MAG TPA: GNAT family N-acetyltransferase [Candidatus Binatia bacterium]|jgi:N-acetylglutamate synthase-like GNAT family acetyltransferase|nr:GNAT family N-acetyltransferase [Candidatus Binatia bacterium]
MVDMPGMQEGTVKIRRGKRTDFPALTALVNAQAPCAATKAQIRHWRRLASDPRLDFYIAEQEGTIRGMVLICYVRELSRPGWQAILDVVVPLSAEDGIGQRLLDFVKERARRRGCQRLLVHESNHERAGRYAPLAQAGFHRVGDILCCGLL